MLIREGRILLGKMAKGCFWVELLHFVKINKFRCNVSGFVKSSIWSFRISCKF